MKRIIKQDGISVTIEIDQLTDKDFQDSLFFEAEGKTYVSYDEIVFDSYNGDVMFYWKGELIKTNKVPGYSQGCNRVRLDGIQGRLVLSKW